MDRRRGKGGAGNKIMPLFRRQGGTKCSTGSTNRMQINEVFLTSVVVQHSFSLPQEKRSYDTVYAVATRTRARGDERPAGSDSLLPLVSPRWPFRLFGLLFYQECERMTEIRSLRDLRATVRVRTVVEIVWSIPRSVFTRQQHFNAYLCRRTTSRWLRTPPSLARVQPCQHKNH